MKSKYLEFLDFKILLIASLLVLFVLRLACPQIVKYLLFPLELIVALFAFIEFMKLWALVKIRNLYLLFFPVILVIAIYSLSFILTRDNQMLLIKDFVNALSVILFLFIALVLIKTKSNLISILSLFSNCIVVSSTIVAFLGIIKLYYQLLGINFKFLSVEGHSYPFGTSLAVDDNFFTLVCFFGIIFIIPKLFKKIKLYSRIIIQISLIILLVNIFLSTSRRGIIIASSISLVLIGISIISVIIKDEKLKYFRKNTTGVGLISILFASSVYYFFVSVSSTERNFIILNSHFNQNETHTYINNLSLSVRSIFNGRAKFQEINYKTFKDNFDPLYPYSGWASGNYSIVTDLPGINKNIVPYGSIGAKVDKLSGSSTWNGNAYYLTQLFELNLIPGKRYIASLFCYVSPDFDGDWIRISSYGKIHGLTTAYYDLQHKGEWQKLETTFTADSGMLSEYLYLSMQNKISLENMKGSIIFAYPNLRETDFDPKQPITWAGSPFDEVSVLPGINKEIVPKGSICFSFKPSSILTKNSMQYAFSNILSLKVSDHAKRIISSIYVYVSENFNGDEVYFEASGDYSGLGTYKYNLGKKGRWERMLLSVSSAKENLKINIGIKKIVKNKSDRLEGEVLFAYPSAESLEYDPKNPLTWATRRFRMSNKLSGMYSQIVPANTYGYTIDKESNFFLSKASGNFTIFTNFGKKVLSNDERLVSSIYCYVSNNFNGNKVKLGVWGYFNGKNSALYDLSKKGTWQKLLLENETDSGFVEPFIFFEIPGNKDITFLNGYVTFAYPEFKIVNKSVLISDSLKADTIKKKISLLSNKSEIRLRDCHGFQLSAHTNFSSFNIFHRPEIYLSLIALNKDSALKPVKCRSKNIDVKMFQENDNESYNIIDKYQRFELPSNNICNTKFLSRFSMSTFFPLLEVFSARFTQKDDSLSFIPEFQKEMDNDHFVGPRLDRWRYALYIFTHDYSIKQKLIGDGFVYTKKFSKMFNNEKTDCDYPHNPFLSILLYSGIIGLLIYIWFLSKSFYYYWIYRKEYWTFGFCFAVTLFFAFFSANTPFDPSIVGIFSILPYIINYFQIKESSDLVSTSR
jgi:hypothetical protein